MCGVTFTCTSWHVYPRIWAAKRHKKIHQVGQDPGWPFQLENPWAHSHSSSCTVRKVIQISAIKHEYSGNHDTTWNIPRYITFSPIHFMLYRGKSIAFLWAQPANSGSRPTTSLSSSNMRKKFWLEEGGEKGSLHAMTKPCRWAGGWGVGGLVGGGWGGGWHANFLILDVSLQPR